MIKQISDNEIYLLLKYIKSVLWREAEGLSYIEDARRQNLNADYLLINFFFFRKFQQKLQVPLVVLS